MFSVLKSNCETCHNDVHYSQFKEAEYSNCERCHSFENWNPVKFDHNKTRFALDGAHEKVSCGKCHKFIEDGDIKYVQYKFDEIKCSNCHS